MKNNTISNTKGDKMRNCLQFWTRDLCLGDRIRLDFKIFKS